MKLLLTLILIVLIIGVLIEGFYVWEIYQKTERQYQSCLETCKSFVGSPRYECQQECKTEYGK